MKAQPGIAYPIFLKLLTRKGFQVGLILVTLWLTLYYNVSYYVYTPLTGVEWEYVDNTFTTIHLASVPPGSPGAAGGLQVGDRLLAIDGQAITSTNRPFYTPKRAGESVRYTIERADKRQTFDVVIGDYWQQPGYLWAALPLELPSLLVYALGLLLCLLAAPQDTRARLVGTVWLLAGLALAAGGPGLANGGWFAFDVNLITYAVGGYLSLAAYMYFPAASFSSQVRLTILRAHLGLTVMSLVAYAWQRMIAGDALSPEALVSGAGIRYIFILTWLLNLTLLLKNRFAVHDPETKRQTQIILLGTLLGVLPALLLYLLPKLALGPQFVILPGNLTVLALAFIPLSYGYVIRQHKLLKIDLYVNRALGWFIIIALALLAAGGVVGLVAWLHGSEQARLLGAVIATAVVMGGLHKRIQVWVDRMLYGASYNFREVTTHLSERLSKISDPRALDDALREFVQQMHIQKSVLLLAHEGQLEFGGPQRSIPLAGDQICQFLLESGKPARALSIWAVADDQTNQAWAAFAWGRVFAPLIYNDTLHGIWVLGDRLIGNYYADEDLQNIQAIVQQVALALTILTNLAALRGLGQRLVREVEEQRRSVARDLHDDILGEWSLLQGELSALQPDLAARQEKLLDKLREIIEQQHTSLMEDGLALALEDLFADLEGLTDGSTTSLRLRNLLPENIALREEIAMILYRIAQEALTNALKHAQANDIVLTLKMDQDDMLEIEIRDDGIGMANPAQSPPGHYGLLSMRERAAMIGATLTITSAPDQGTSLTVRLKV